MKVDLLVSTYRQFNSNAYAAIQAMVNYTKAQGVDLAVPAIYGSALVHRSRNKALQSLREDADFVLFCDDDMAPMKDSLMRLLELRLPIVSAYTVTREFPPKIAAKVWNEEREMFVPLDRLRENRVIKDKLGLGTGFLLVQKAVLDAAIEWHLSANDWLAENRRRLDRLHVRTEEREKERAHIEARRRQNYLRDKSDLLLFDYVRQDNELQMGEDTSFCWKLLMMGYETALDTSVSVGHVGDFAYTPEMLECETALDPIIADCLRPDHSAVITPGPRLVV